MQIDKMLYGTYSDLINGGPQFDEIFAPEILFSELEKAMKMGILWFNGGAHTLVWAPQLHVEKIERDEKIYQEITLKLDNSMLAGWYPAFQSSSVMMILVMGSAKARLLYSVKMTDLD